MFEVGDRIRTNRSASVRYGVIHQVDADGAVLGEFDDGQFFFRDASMLDDLCPPATAAARPAAKGTGPQRSDRSPGSA